jgi:hypothetical protein
VLRSVHALTCPRSCGFAVDVIKPWMPLWFQRTLLRLFLKLSVGPYERYVLCVCVCVCGTL